MILEYFPIKEILSFIPCPILSCPTLPDSIQPWVELGKRS